MTRRFASRAAHQYLSGFLREAAAAVKERGFRGDAGAPKPVRSSLPPKTGSWRYAMSEVGGASQIEFGQLLALHTRLFL